MFTSLLFLITNNKTNNVALYLKHIGINLNYT